MSLRKQIYSTGMSRCEEASVPDWGGHSIFVDRTRVFFFISIYKGSPSPTFFLPTQPTLSTQACVAWLMYCLPMGSQSARIPIMGSKSTKIYFRRSHSARIPFSSHCA